MRRPHVYERSAPRRRREDGARAPTPTDASVSGPDREGAGPRDGASAGEGCLATGADPAEAARGIARAMPALMAMAEDANLPALASLLDAAWAEAERAEDDAGRA